MTPEASPADDRFLTVGPGGARLEMTPLTCPACLNRVLVHKSSPAQTTVQWLERLHCATLLEASTRRERALVSGCPVLNAAIDDALLSGAIAVPIDSSRE